VYKRKSSTKYLRVYCLSEAYLLLNVASYDGEILHTDAYRPVLDVLISRPY